MKRHLMICIALVAMMASCVKEPYIYRRLTPEEAAVIPYQMGQKLNFENQDGDTLCFTVVYDSTFRAAFYDEAGFYPQTKSIGPRPYFYMREVVLQSLPEDSCLLRCRVAPEKIVTISYEKLKIDSEHNGNLYPYWDLDFGLTLWLDELPTTTLILGDTTYENVCFDEGAYMQDTTLFSWGVHYCEQAGLLVIKFGDVSLRLVPWF